MMKERSHSRPPISKAEDGNGQHAIVRNQRSYIQQRQHNIVSELQNSLERKEKDFFGIKTASKGTKTTRLLRSQHGSASAERNINKESFVSCEEEMEMQFQIEHGLHLKKRINQQTPKVMKAILPGVVQLKSSTLSMATETTEVKTTPN